MKSTAVRLSIILILVLSCLSFSKEGVLFSEKETEYLMAYGLPVRLRIPNINIDARVEHVSFAQNQAMDTPKNTDNVAWFMLGPKPGEVGSAVMDGHYGWKNGKPVVFDALYTLQVGDRVFVVSDIGVTSSFIVREVKTYDQNADTHDIFYSSDGKSHLNLITCNGAWNKNSKTYSKRLVVFTDKE